MDTNGSRRQWPSHTWLNLNIVCLVCVISASTSTVARDQCQVSSSLLVLLFIYYLFIIFSFFNRKKFPYNIFWSVTLPVAPLRSCPPNSLPFFLSDSARLGFLQFPGSSLSPPPQSSYSSQDPLVFTSPVLGLHLYIGLLSWLPGSQWAELRFFMLAQQEFYQLSNLPQPFSILALE